VPCARPHAADYPSGGACAPVHTRRDEVILGLWGWDADEGEGELKSVSISFPSPSMQKNVQYIHIYCFARLWASVRSRAWAFPIAGRHNASRGRNGPAIDAVIRRRQLGRIWGIEGEPSFPPLMAAKRLLNMVGHFASPQSEPSPKSTAAVDWTTAKLPGYDALPGFKDFPGCAWGVWGPDDELGTVNLLTEEVVKIAASEEIKIGRTVSLNWWVAADVNEEESADSGVLRPLNFPEKVSDDVFYSMVLTWVIAHVFPQVARSQHDRYTRGGH
jgi:hypothetical protein